MTSLKANIIPINKINKSDDYALVPGYHHKKKVRKLKEFKRSKGKCIFTNGISKSLMDFIYRAVLQLKLKEKRLIFSRGAVKINDESVLYAAGIRELDWDAGISIRIPQKLNQNKRIKLNIDDKEYELNLQEIVVLSALLKIAYPPKSPKWYTDTAIMVIVKGWKYLL
jgi:hypothetical protein